MTHKKSAMRIIIFFLVIFCLIQSQSSMAQVPKEAMLELKQQVTDLKKEIADLQKQIAIAKTEDPESVKNLEEQLAQLKKQLALIENINKGIRQMPGSVKQQFDNANEEVPTGFPAKKTALLNALPKRTLTQQELIAFLVALHNELEKKLPPDVVQAVQDIIAKSENNYAKIAMKGVAAWYNNAPSESVLLITYAASKLPDDNTLNNCGAILNLYGREDKALPVLKYVLPHQPDNCTLLNNIGQAFAGLGEKDSANFYFALVLRRCSTHPEANATAAYIAYSNGDTTLAANYMEQSLLGAYSEERMDFYKNIRANAKPLIDPEISLSNKNYFIPNGFIPAPNCKNWDDCEIVTAKQETIKKQLAVLRKKYENIVIENSHPNLLKTHQDSLDWISGKGWKDGPFAKKAQYLKKIIGDAYTEPRMNSVLELERKSKALVNKINSKINALDKVFEPQYAACQKVGGDCLTRAIYRYCLARKDLDNEYFLELAQIAELNEQLWYPKDVKYYNNLVYLTAFTAPNKHVLKAECATYTNLLIDQIRTYTLSECNPIGKPTCIEPPPPEPEELPLLEFKEGECPVNIRIPFIVGHVSLNCERFEFEGGEGIIFKYERNFEKHESSFAVGFGEEAAIPFVADGAATATVGFKFDSNNQTTDVFAAARADVYVPGWGTPVIMGEAKIGISSGFHPAFTVMGK